MPRDRLLEDYRAAEALADTANDNDRRERLVVEALWGIIQHDTDPVLRAACRARYLEITDGKPMS